MTDSPETAPAAPTKPLSRVLRSPQPWIILGGVLVLLVAARFLLASRQPPLPAYFEIPAFELTSHEGVPFGTKQLRGKVWIAGFFFTRCPTICPVLLQRQSDVRARTEDLGDAVQLVSISIDPEHDTPEVLRTVAKERGLKLERWTLLTGRTEEIQGIVREGFKEYLKTGPDVAPEDVVHSVRFFLVDAHGQVRGLYDGLDEASVKRLVADAARLGREAAR